MFALSLNPFRNSVTAAALAICIQMPAQASVMSFDLGKAANFNAFILEDMYAINSDTEGRLAVGGNLFLNNYAIGMELNNSQGARNDLIVGGDANFTNGRVYSGNAVIGGTDHIAQSVGFYSETNGTNFVESGTKRAGNPLDFTAIGRELQEKATSWGSLAATGQTVVSEWNEITVKGKQGANIFNVNGDDLSKAGTFWFDLPTNSFAIINVFGSYVDMSSMGFHHVLSSAPDQKILDNNPGVYRHDGSLTNNVLFNFVDATELLFHSIGIKASVLAPFANVSFFNGHIDGQLISKSLSSPFGEYSGQINNYRFSAKVPEPAVILMFVLGLAIILMMSTRRIKAVPDSAHAA
ncbi:choice-of-anchor A family protein [Aliiglaciecola sp. CAU 1673]|uniref:choice-of-anchor A family protein n=1 Tax=Aliiglaciecola sp. CAU 1673 TaxID=3032595 RepID=UPI0023DB94FE|nr:choice-of-anchor A family protein [Aliiglaciecola sp. CAU 1673]MDF2179656.1 choice-of-anchor A family protein [Aliiglaciecola sp. CAU 1673]